MPTLTSPTLTEILAALRGHSPHTEPSLTAARNASVAMILRESPEGNLETLFMKRAEHPADPWSGQMSFPGGRVEVYDATLEHAARRETAEEVGIRLAPEMHIGRLDDVEGGRLSVHRLAVSPFVYHHPDPPAPLHNREVAGTVWVPLAYLSEPTNIRAYRFPADPLRRDFPSFQYGPYIIWGLTYRIIGSFVRLFGVDLPGEPRVTEVE